MSSVVRRFPFLTVGLLTAGLFLLTAGANNVAGDAAVVRGLTAIVRVLIIPMWLMRDLEMILGGRLPFAVPLFVDLPLLFTPYLVADLVLRKLTSRPEGADSL